jgi:hypothetical protein
VRVNVSVTVCGGGFRNGLGKELEASGERGPAVAMLPSGQESLAGFLVNHNRVGEGDWRKVVILKVVKVLCFVDLWQVFILKRVAGGF